MSVIPMHRPLSRIWARLFALLLGVVAVPSLALSAATPQAPQGTVVDGRARFTVITPTLIRMEYSKDGKFINQRSYFAWERNVKPPQYKVNRSSKGLQITTSRMRLTWRGGAHSFDAKDVSIAFNDGNGTWKTWRPGDKQTGNLGGTLHSLEGCDGAEPLPDGVVSRDGWYLYVDNTFLVSDGPHPWIRPRPADEVDD